MKGLLARIPRLPRRRQPVQPSAAPTPIAGADPAVPGQATFRDRGRLRRRLRYLRRVRELGFRDLGGLVFDQHRFERPNDDLVRGKLAALSAVDSELRALEALLDDPRPLHELREPGVAACMRCGALHGSDARFCPSCGVAISGPRAVGEIARAAPVAGPAAGDSTPPAAQAEPPTEVAEPSPVHDAS